MNGKSTPGKLKLLVDSDVLTDTIKRLSGCAALIEWKATVSDSPELIAIGYLLANITDDLFREVRASVDMEKEARRRNRQRT